MRYFVLKAFLFLAAVASVCDGVVLSSRSLRDSRNQRRAENQIMWGKINKMGKALKNGAKNWGKGWRTGQKIGERDEEWGKTIGERDEERGKKNQKSDEERGNFFWEIVQQETVP